MGTVERVALAIVGVAFVTTLILPDRQTARVAQAFGSVFNTALRTSMGR
jgi:hypothetical protein